MTGQIISVPIKLLQTREAVRSTEEVIVIRGYLLRAIEGMRSPAFKRNNKITFEGIYKELHMKKLDKKAFKEKSFKVRSHVNAILDEWVEQGYIKAYEQYKERKTIKGVAVTLEDIVVNKR